MLDHSEPAVISGFGQLNLVLLDLRKLNLAKFVLLGVHRGPCVHVVQRRLAFGLVAIARQLQIHRRRHGFVGQVDDFVLDVDGVASTAKRICLDHAQATAFGAKANVESVLPGLQRGGAVEQLERRPMIRKIAADDSALRNVDTIRAHIEQYRRGIRIVALARHQSDQSAGGPVGRCGLVDQFHSRYDSA